MEMGACLVCWGRYQCMALGGGAAMLIQLIPMGIAPMPALGMLALDQDCLVEESFLGLLVTSEPLGLAKGH